MVKSVTKNTITEYYLFYQNKKKIRKIFLHIIVEIDFNALKLNFYIN